MAPAGNSASMNAAIRAGADEVYMGISGFGARRFAENFSVEEYCLAVSDAHRYGTAVNITLNTIMSPEELEALHTPLEQLYAAGVDAVIIQDLGFADFLKTHFPRWERHASTQLSIATPEEARWAEAQGFSRLVLARELSFTEIAAIRKAVKAELEVFASGALCLACSGKCFLSSFIGGRSGNRGMCTQPCRQKYRKIRSSMNGKPFQDSNDNQDRFYLSSCDQWQEFPEIVRLYDLGVEVIKLEGRMKSPEYVYEAVRYYRGILDSLHALSPEELSEKMKKVRNSEPEMHPHPEVERVFNRGYSKGYMYENDPDFINTTFSASWGVKAADVKHRKIHLTAPLRHGDGIVFLDKNLQKLDGWNVNRILLAKTGEAVSEAPRGAVVELGAPVPANSVYLYKTYDMEFMRVIESEMKRNRRRSAVTARLYAHVGAPLTLELSAEVLGRKFRAQAQSAENLNPSQKLKTSRETLAAALDRFGETPFTLDAARSVYDFDPEVFVPKSVLNELRQNAAAHLEAEIIAGLQRKPVKIDVLPQKETENRSVNPKVNSDANSDVNRNVPPEITAAVTTLAQAWECQNCGIKKIYRLEPPVHFGNADRPEPPFRFAPLAGSLFDAIRFSENGTAFALDWMFHTANPNSVRYYAKVFPLAETLFLSPEISAGTVEKLAAMRREKEAESASESASENQNGNAYGNLPRLGMVVYGYLYGMYTRKTLFPEDFTELQNADGRPVYVTRNAASENTLEMSGSRVYYGNCMDITSALFRNPVAGISEFRLDFTLETPEEVRKILNNVQIRGWNQKEIFSYGYEKGIF